MTKIIHSKSLPHFPRISYDPEAQAAYIYLANGSARQTRSLSPHVNADCDHGRVVGYEFLGVPPPKGR